MEITTQTKINYLKYAGTGYIIAGLAFISFGFPFWFLNAVDEIPKHHNLLPFVIIVDDLFPMNLKFWSVTICSIGLLIGSYSLYKVGEPTGFGTKRRFFYVALLGGFCYFLSTWMLIPFAPLGAFLSALGMILIGIASLKTKLWLGWKRFSPLLVGVFPFFFMYPLLLITGQRPAALIGCWGFSWILLGVVCWLRIKEVKRLSR
ncbi:hypothetical protein ACFOG5_11415 [Pedobacter fastidiosus]|uniref:DUF998 domain-containing protein n=1 Tax=Pedobacter fastidiosus TaxID=2765361 RepID=A0ABR7KXA7_9SPHI|nr:hypothetical protein [Pedobacter fastidiosus]MBC6112660.1 hypothetical protein [Pedobacter fastidiosus]